MTELFTEIPSEVKQQHEQIVKLAFKTLTPFQSHTFLKNYINTCENEEEKNFIEFFINLLLEQYKHENDIN